MTTPDQDFAAELDAALADLATKREEQKAQSKERKRLEALQRRGKGWGTPLSPEERRSLAQDLAELEKASWTTKFYIQHTKHFSCTCGATFSLFAGFYQARTRGAACSLRAVGPEEVPLELRSYETRHEVAVCAECVIPAKPIEATEAEVGEFATLLLELGLPAAEGGLELGETAEEAEADQDTAPENEESTEEPETEGEEQ